MNLMVIMLEVMNVDGDHNLRLQLATEHIRPLCVEVGMLPCYAVCTGLFRGFIMAKTKKQVICDHLIDLIKDNGMLKNDKLGSESALAKLFNMSRTTIRDATRELIDKGIIYRINGSGLFVGEPKMMEQIHYHHLASFNERAKKQGMIANRKVISINILKPNEKIASELNIKETDYVYHIIRLMKFDDMPITLENFFMPVSMFPNLDVSIIETSKYKYVENVTGKRVKESIQILKPIIVEDDHTRSLLKLDVNQPVMCVKEVGYLSDGTPFEVNTSISNSKLIEINQIAIR